MRTFGVLLLIIGLAACNLVVLNLQRPSPAFEQMRAQFEREILAIEGQYSDGEELTRAAAPVATRIFGADWDLVRAEAQRTLATGTGELDQIRAAMTTWQNVSCSTIPLTDRGNTGVDVGVVQAQFGFGGTGGVAANIQHAGFLAPGFFLQLGSANILGVTFTFMG